jgi:hypothetical protein
MISLDVLNISISRWEWRKVIGGGHPSMILLELSLHSGYLGMGSSVDERA